MSQFRYNKLTQHWVLFAPNRAKKPTNFKDDSEVKRNIESCPFESGNESKTPKELLRIGDDKSWRCRIVPNLYNALNIEDEAKSFKRGCFENRSGFGAHEVIVETPSHRLQMFDFDIDHFFDYFSIIKLRIEDLKKDIRLKYFSIFKNHGQDSGASLEHSHSQLIATPFIPKSVDDDLKRFKEYKEKTDRYFFDDMIHDELNYKEGILFENSSFISYCPYASRFPFEVNIVSKKESLRSIIDFDDTDIYSLSNICNKVFQALKKALGDVSFNMIVKNGAVQDKENQNRFHILILPRIYKIAGFELDTDIMINTFLPSTASKILKNSLKDS